MSKSKNIPEILAPAGDFICLNAALQAKADAVYFGVKGFNMRAGAKNFTIAEMKKVVSLCHKAGAKAYLTLNTIYYENELKKLDALLKKAAQAKLDAVIAWDYAVISIAKKHGVEVHLSTQASVANSEAIVGYHKNFGIQRFVLARECSIDDIAKLRKNAIKQLGKKANIEIEVFAHGAMCVSESGRCFLSTFSCGKSANRGECMQPCRREYQISDGQGHDFTIGNGYVLSPKDMCVLPFIEKLFQANVDSLKIEGRNRNPEYVYTVISTYKKVRDYYFANKNKEGFEESFKALKDEAVQTVSNVFNRGFSDGFFMGKPIGDWTSAGNVAKKKKTIVGHVVKFYPKISVAEISIDASEVSLGQTIQIEGDKTGFIEMQIESMQFTGQPIQKAKKGQNIAIKVPKAVKRFDRIYTSK